MTRFQKDLAAARTEYRKLRDQAPYYFGAANFDARCKALVWEISGGEDGEGVEPHHWVAAARRVLADAQAMTADDLEWQACQNGTC